jgi:thiosulfate reductase cytochrome b subunit
MQSITYQIVMLLVVPIQFATGLMMWDIKRFEGVIGMLGGLEVVNTVHVLIYIFFISFTMIHAYMGALGHTPATHFREMFTGFEEEH